MFFCEIAFSNKAEKMLIFEQFWSTKTVENHYKFASKNVFENFFDFLQNLDDFGFILKPQNALRKHLKIDFGSLRRRSGTNLVLQGQIWVDSGWFGSYFYAILWYFMLFSMLFYAILVYFVLFYAILCNFMLFNAITNVILCYFMLFYAILRYFK